MIMTLSGTVTLRGEQFVVVENGGIGYKVSLPEGAPASLQGDVALYTHEVIREDGRELFGFLSLEALELFWKLLNVSGVGPRSAQKIVFAADVGKVRESIMKGDVAFLTHVQGIGNKTAQKIILELKGALVDLPVASVADADAVEALVGLGYQRRQAVDVLSGIEGANTEDRIRAALKILSR